MKKEDELEQLKVRLAVSQKKIKSLTGKLERSRTKISKQKSELKKKETKIIEVSDEQLQSLSNRLPDINIKSLLSD